MNEIEKQPENKRKKLLLLLLLLLLLSVGGYLIYQHFNQPDTPVTVVSGEFCQMARMQKKFLKKNLRIWHRKK